MKCRFALFLLILFISSELVSQEHPKTRFSPYVDDRGNISRPPQYRDSWTHLGTYFVMNETQYGPGMHQVYVEKPYLDSYRETGKWPDGTVIIKEVLRTAEDELTTGTASWATDPEVWFVMVKDEKGRFPDNPLWGAGWGWALFKSDAPDDQVATNYRQDCMNCHIPARKTDWVYVQGYPSVHNSPRNIGDPN